MNEQTHTLGAILAGGEARRFGSDKAHALFEGKRLIDRVYKTLARETAQVIICGRDEDGFTCIPDKPNNDLGPLGGLNAALHYAQEKGFTHVLSAPCDTPRLPHNLSQTLTVKGGASIAENLPVIGLWPTVLAATLDAFVAGGGRSLYKFAGHVGAHQITFDETILNINRPEDLP